MKNDLQSKLWQVGPAFVQGSPHAAYLGFEFVAIDIGRATLRLPYDAKLIGDPKTRVLHGGVVTALIDHTAGLAAFSSLGADSGLATLDMRIDYMRAAEPNKAVLAQARCYRTTRDVAFVRAIAHDGDVDDPVAMAQATFMVKAGGVVSKEAKDEPS